jgi:hypothetical protein
VPVAYLLAAAKYADGTPSRERGYAARWGGESRLFLRRPSNASASTSDFVAHDRVACARITSSVERLRWHCDITSLRCCNRESAIATIICDS